MRFSTSAILVVLCFVKVYGQSGVYRMGGRAMGMGFTSGTIGDEWSAFSNIGAIAMDQQSASASFACQSIFSLRELSNKAAIVNVPYGKFCSDLNFFSFGDDHFNETRLGVGIGHKIKFVSLGIQLNYLQWVIEQAGTRGMFYLEAGGVAELFPGFRIGVSLQNINRIKISKTTGEELPVRMEMTLSYKPQDFLILNFTLDDLLPDGIAPRAGIEYSIHDKFFIRTGLCMKPVENYFGFGIRAWHFNIDYALSSQNYLGLNHQVSLTAFLNRKK